MVILVRAPTNHSWRAPSHCMTRDHGRDHSKLRAYSPQKASGSATERCCSARKSFTRATFAATRGAGYSPEPASRLAMPTAFCDELIRPQVQEGMKKLQEPRCTY